MRYNQIKKEAEPSYFFQFSSLFVSILLLFTLLFASFLISGPTSNYMVKLSLIFPFINVLFKAELLSSNLVHYLFPIFLFIILIILGRQNRKIYDKYRSQSDNDIRQEYALIQKITYVIYINFVLILLIAINLLFQNILNYTIVIILSAIALYKLMNYTKFYTQRVKNRINEEFRKNYPFLEISTVGAERFSGQLQNIFDYEAITLIHDNSETKIMWSAVASLKEVKISHNK